jgi:hypothetical protein
MWVHAPGSRATTSASLGRVGRFGRWVEPACEGLKPNHGPLLFILLFFPRNHI